MLTTNSRGNIEYRGKEIDIVILDTILQYVDTSDFVIKFKQKGMNEYFGRLVVQKIFTYAGIITAK